MGNAKYSAILFLLLVYFSFLLAGCSRSIKALEDQESKGRLMRAARAKELEGDTNAAIQLYKEAVAKNPRLVRAHLDIALLLQNEGKDYTGAIQHYRKYLELRPETEKKEMILGKIREASLLLTSEVSRADLPDIRTTAERGKTGEELEKSGVKRQNAPASILGRGNGRPPVSSAGPQAAGQRAYVVRNGDTLTSIAAQMYNDKNKWRRIAEANRDALRDSNTLKVGQTLAIPGD